MSLLSPTLWGIAIFGIIRVARKRRDGEGYGHLIVMREGRQRGMVMPVRGVVDG